MSITVLLSSLPPLSSCITCFPSPCSPGVCPMLCAQWLRLRRLTVAHVTWTHLWPAARGSCQAAVTRPTPQRRRSARTRPRRQGHPKCPIRPVTHRWKTCRLTNACARRTRRSFTVETLTCTHSQVIWVFFFFSVCVCCLLISVPEECDFVKW